MRGTSPSSTEDEKVEGVETGREKERLHVCVSDSGVTCELIMNVWYLQKKFLHSGSRQSRSFMTSCPFYIDTLWVVKRSNYYF